MIRVLVVDDSGAVRHLLSYILQSDPEISVVGRACNGEEALQMLETLQPDLITMDIAMPGLDGLQVTRMIMEKRPTPIVIVTANRDLAGSTFKMLEAGALASLEKPPGPSAPEFAECKSQLISTVRSLAGVKPQRLPRRADVSTSLKIQKRKSLQIIGIGASTGGPQALRCILEALPEDFPLPILITQHMSIGFTEDYARWLGQSGKLPVTLATAGEDLLAGHAYVAPDDRHLGVTKNHKALISDSEREYGMRPAVSFMFKSMRYAFGASSVAVLLTGMGRDGAEELGELKKVGAMTIAQDKETSLIFGMPGRAIALGNAEQILPIESIASALLQLVSA